MIRKIFREVNLGFHGRFLPLSVPIVNSVPLLVPPFVRMSVVYVLSIHLSRRNEGTEVSEWRTEEGKNGVRNGSFIYHSLRRSFPAPMSLGVVTLTSILPRLRRTKWGETNGRNWEMIDRRVTRLVWCFVSLRLLPSPSSRSTFGPLTRPSLGGPSGERMMMWGKHERSEMWRERREITEIQPITFHTLSRLT